DQRDEGLGQIVFLLRLGFGAELPDMTDRPFPARRLEFDVSDRAAAVAALDAIPDPLTGQGLVAAGRVKGLIVVLRRAGFALEVTPEEREQYLPVRDAAEAALKALPGITQVSVVLTTDVTETPPRRRTAGLSREAVDPGRAKA